MASTDDRSRPVAVRFGAMGDMVMFLPSLRILAERWGTRVDVVASGSWAPEILAHSGVLGDLVVLPGTRRRPMWMSGAKRRLLRWVRSRPDAPVLVFERNTKFEEFLVHGRVDPQRVARLADFRPLQQGHQVEDERAFAAAALENQRGRLDEIRLSTYLPTLDCPERHLEDARHWLGEERLASGPLVLIQPGNKRTMRRRRFHRSSDSKHWPTACWARVVRAVRRKLANAVILICGVPAEQPVARTIARAAGLSRAQAVADRLPLHRLIALQTLAHSMISVDTGPAHSAVAVGCPTVVLYGTMDPKRYRPIGTGPTRLVTARGHYGSEAVSWSAHPLIDIDPRNVIEAWNGLGGRLLLADGP